MNTTSLLRRGPRRSLAAPAVTRSHSSARSKLMALGLPLATLLLHTAAAQNTYLPHYLVSDILGLADYADANLLNPWGLASSPTGPFLVSDNHAGLATAYDGAGVQQSTLVTLPPPAGGMPPAAPTAIVFNNTPDFLLAPSSPAQFIWATEDGTISAWNAGTNAVLKVDDSAAGTVYKGLALASGSGGNLLFATDFHGGKIDVFDAQFHPATLPGAFTDPTIPAGFAPFGIQTIGGQLLVTYAMQDAAKHDDVSGPGHGYVDVFDTSGNLVKRLVSVGALNSPWGLTLAPAGFGAFSGMLLIGNFGDGRINAFDPATGAFAGTLTDASGKPFSVPGLWDLKFGNGGQGGDANTLYFTAGIAGGHSLEDHGLFARLAAAVPRLTSVVDDGVAVTLGWGGGIGPFLLQEKADLADAAWFDVLTTTNRSVTVAKVSPGGFFRVVNQAATTVLPFTVLLNGASEVPATPNGTGFGVGQLAIAGSNLTYRISFSGLSAPATAAHIHSPATATNSAGVQVPLGNVPGATAGTIAGSTSLTAAQLADIVNGRAYVNIHNTNHPGGEIRGQIVPLQIGVTLNGASEVPPVTTAATGTGRLTLIGSQLFYDLSYAGLTGAATAAHIHGSADPTQPAAVLVPLNTPTGTAGTISGTVPLTPTELSYLLAGLAYINIHTTTNAAGEIRGQIVLPH